MEVVLYKVVLALTSLLVKFLVVNSKHVLRVCCAVGLSSSCDIDVYGCLCSIRRHRHVHSS